MPFEIPENWVWTTIEDIAESNIGLTYKPTDICANGVPVYRSNNIQNRRICLKELVRVNTNILEKQYLQEGDLLICARNGSRNLVGKCALIDNLNEPTSFGAFMAVCRSALNPWIFQILNSEYFNTYLDDSNSTAINQVTQKMLLAFQLPIPPASEQERIISKLKQWYEYIDEIEDRKIELESYIKQTKSKILDLAISGKLVPQDPNDEPAIELLKRINPDFQPCDNSHYENLPQGWAVCRLSDMVRIQNGFAFQSAKYIDVGIRIIRITNVQSGYIIDESPKFYPHNLMEGLDEYNLKNGDLLMSLTGNVGRVGIMPENLLPAALNQRVCCLKPKNNDIDKMYLFYYFQAEQFIQDCIASGKGVAQLNVSTEWLKHYIIQLPPKEEQSRIVKTIDALFSIIDKITAEL